MTGDGSEIEQLRTLVARLKGTIEAREGEVETLRENVCAVTGERNELEALIDNLYQSILWFGPDGVLQHYNKQTVCIHGFQDEGLAAVKTIEDYAFLLANKGEFGKGDPARLAKLHADDLLKRLRLQSTVMVYLQALDRHLRARYTDLPDGGFVITHVDVTAEVETEQKLSEANRRARLTAELLERERNDLTTVLDNLRQSVMWYDKQGNLKLRNKQAGALHDMSAEQIAGISTFSGHLKVLAERGDLGDAPQDQLIAESQERVFGELKGSKNYRKFFPYTGKHISVTLAETPDGGRILSEVDITEQVKAEEDLERTLQLVEDANLALEDKVEERTKKLRELQDTMIKAERQATMSELIAKLSHELRNPLNALSTSLYIIRSKVGDDERLTKAFDRSERTIKRCTRILSDLFDYAMAQQLNTKPIEISAWLDENTQQISLPGDVTLDYQNQLGGTNLEIDRKPMTKAIWKVIHNAILALQDGGADSKDKRLVIRARRDADRVMFEISDNGPGMPEEICNRALEPLFSTRGFGVGLGLPIAQQVFEQHGGGLEIESTRGQGTTVRMWLPAAQSLDQAA